MPINRICNAILDWSWNNNITNEIINQFNNNANNANLKEFIAKIALCHQDCVNLTLIDPQK